MNYADILASIIHDIKNSMSVVTNHVEQIMVDPALNDQMHERASVMQQELRRANNQLVQALTLYKLDNQRLSPKLLENNVYDFLEELLVEEQALAEAQSIDLQLDCDEWLAGYFDPDLVRGVLSSTIGNAKRYSNGQVLLSAEEQDGWLVIRVEDDGAGFPEAFLNYRHGVDADDFGQAFKEGRTQLGFFFANKIAQAHVNGQSNDQPNNQRQGYICLKNARQLPGGCFEIWLP